jgi:hypothetical protein
MSARTVALRTELFITYPALAISCLRASGLVLDGLQQTVLMLGGRAFRSYVERFIPPLLFAGQYVANSARNVRLFMTDDFHFEDGKKGAARAEISSMSSDSSRSQKSRKGNHDLIQLSPMFVSTLCLGVLG